EVMNPGAQLLTVAEDSRPVQGPRRVGAPRQNGPSAVDQQQCLRRLPERVSHDDPVVREKLGVKIQEPGWLRIDHYRAGQVEGAMEGDEVDCGPVTAVAGDRAERGSPVPREVLPSRGE